MSESCREWKAGKCFGLHGCGWAQRGNDSDTYAHFSSYRSAAEYAREENAADEQIRRLQRLWAQGLVPPSGKERGE